MSSHHYVKEGQEPALIIANGESCSYTLLEQMLQWSPFVVALDGAYCRLEELEIKMDVVIGDFDSIGNYEPKPDIEYIKIDEQESTDLEKGLDFLAKAGYIDVNIIWATGLRIDHTLNNIATLGRYKHMNLVMYDDYSKVYVLPKLFEKYFKKGDKISLIALESSLNIKTKGLRYALNNEPLGLVSRSGSSNMVEKDGLVRIEHSDGILILIESYEN